MCCVLTLPPCLAVPSQHRHKTHAIIEGFDRQHSDAELERRVKNGIALWNKELHFLYHDTLDAIPKLASTYMTGGRHQRVGSTSVPHAVSWSAHVNTLPHRVSNSTLTFLPPFLFVPVLPRSHGQTFLRGAFHALQV